MELKILKRGMKGPLVGVWQEFLFGELLYTGSIDQDFGNKTDRATKSYEKARGFPKDGIVDDELWAAAILDGLFLSGSRSALPPAPGFKPLSVAQKHKLFGVIESVPAPTRGNPEGIRITNDWQSKNLIKVKVPQLEWTDDTPKNCSIFVNKVAAEPIKALFKRWEEEGLMRYVDSWAGSWAPRYVRRSPGVLSSHAWGTAFDINAAWNGLSRRPAGVDSTGTVIPLVRAANELGFWWGGHWERPDGMHFELVHPEAYCLPAAFPLKSMTK